MKKLPIGIQTFEKIRKDNYYYVDKTYYVYKLANEGGGYYFLARPRRFGKSLFVDTLKEAFSGNKELFEGLFLESHWDWSKKYPVILIDFSSGVKNVEQLLHLIRSILLFHTEKYDITISNNDVNIQFLQLIRLLCEKHKTRIIVLIDEYDKPILDNIDEKQTANEIRELLRGFYSVLKGSDSYIKFVFITGVMKFNQVSIFSGLNQLKDITLSPNYSAICGYTEEEMIKVFSDRLEGLNIEEVRKWYNGYSWLGECVYNPFDVLLYLDDRLLQPYWFATGTPTFLMKLIKEKKYYVPQLDQVTMTDSILNSFDIDNIDLENLLFQTGYLTIKSIENIQNRYFYHMSYPNYEVKISFNDNVLGYLTNAEERSVRYLNIYKALRDNDLKRMEGELKLFFSSIPYQWYLNNRLNEYEGYYASIMYSLMMATGFYV